MNSLNKQTRGLTLMRARQTSHRSGRNNRLTKVITITVSLTLLAASLAALRASASGGTTYDNCYEDTNPTLLYRGERSHLNTHMNIYGCFTQKDNTGSFHMWSLSAPWDEPLCEVGYGDACHLCHERIITPPVPPIPADLIFLPLVAKE